MQNATFASQNQPAVSYPTRSSFAYLTSWLHERDQSCITDAVHLVATNAALLFPLCDEHEVVALQEAHAPNNPVRLDKRYKVKL